MTTKSEMASVNEGSTKFGFKANITMPFKILAIKSNTSGEIVTLTRERTGACIDTIEWPQYNNDLSSLLTDDRYNSSAEVNRPRMWVEKKGDSEAAMLTFYPDITAVFEEGCNVLVLVDTSVPMKSDWKRVLERAKLISTMLRPGMRFNIGTVGTGPSMGCFPGYKNATKSNILTASRFIETIKPISPSCELWRSLFAEYLTMRVSSLMCGTTSNLTQMTTRSELASVNEGSTKFGFKANITMPFKILAIKSNSYPLNIKMTDTMAVVGWEGSAPSTDFEVLVTVAEVNRPRMWVEKKGDSEAAMLTFYPDITAAVEEGCNVLVLVDTSIPMKSDWKRVLERAKLIITMLRLGMRFNIGTVGTGPSMECFSGYKNATKSNILTASRFIETIKPISPSCELWRSVFAEYLTSTGASNISNVIFVSAGLISQPDLTLNVAGKLPSTTRLFTVYTSIDLKLYSHISGANAEGNRHLMQSLARRGGGYCEILEGEIVTLTREENTVRLLL
eukprot:sb/3464001/